jgi:uncharacterized protein (DUF342 family)
MLEKIALQKNLITQTQCAEALEACRTAPNLELALKDYFVSKNIIPLSQMKQLIFTFHALNTMKKNNVFGRIAVKLGFIKNADFQEEINRQKESIKAKKQPQFIGELWVKNNTIARDQFRKVIQIQKKKSGSPSPPGQTTSASPGEKKENSAAPAPDPQTEVPQAETPLAVETAPEEKEYDYSLVKKLPGGVILEIDKTGMTAFFKKTDTFDDTISPSDLMDHLMDNDILYGIVTEENIQGFIQSKGFKEKPFKVASGRPHKLGKDARVEYYFDTDHLKAGGLGDEGKIDFKDRGQVPWVEEGSLLAEKFPMIEACNGTNIFDQIIEVPPAIDIPLRFKSGVVMSEDELKLYAEISGHPRLNWSGNIQVTDTFVVKNDVDYETGHLEYSGDIDVKGTLKAGFRVKGQTVSINTVDGGDIHAQGNVTILNGANDARIYARGNVTAKFIQNSEVFCLGNLIVQKEIVDCKIETSGAVIIPTGEVISSKVTCNLGLSTRHLGTDKSVPNTIIMGQDAFTEKEIKEIKKKIIQSEERIQQIREKTASLSKEMANFHQDTSRLAHELDRVRADGFSLSKELSGLEKDEKQAATLKSHIQKNNALFSRLDKDLNQYFDRIEKNENQILDMEVELDQLEEELEDLQYEEANFNEWQTANPGITEIGVTGRVSPGTMVSSPKASREITESLTNVKIKEVLSPEKGRPEIQAHDNIKRK